MSYAAYADGTYDAHAYTATVSGGPAWVRSEHYAIDAKTDVAATRFQMLGPMTRTLLEDRFKLKVHRTDKSVPIYLLNVSKKGAKLQHTKEGDCPNVDGKAPLAPLSGPPCGRMRFSSGSIAGHGLTMNSFALLLGPKMDRDVFDATGLYGIFDFRLEFSPDSATPGFGRPPPDSQDPTASIFTALEDQLGLKLQPAKGTAAVLVIDQVEGPSEN